MSYLPKDWKRLKRGEVSAARGVRLRELGLFAASERAREALYVQAATFVPVNEKAF
jgi:hypothetical protein